MQRSGECDDDIIILDDCKGIGLRRRNKASETIKKKDKNIIFSLYLDVTLSGLYTILSVEHKITYTKNIFLIL